MRHALFSISYAGPWGQAALDLPAVVRRAGALGFGAVMLAGKRPHLSPLDADEGAVAAVRSALAEAGVACPAVAAYVDLGATGAAEVPYLELQIAYVEALCRVGARLGATIVRVFTAYDGGGQSPHALWRQTVTALRAMCDRAAPHGVTVAVQNHHDLAVQTAALLELLADVGRPNGRLGFDAWSPALRGEDLYEAARQGNRIHKSHIYNKLRSIGGRP